jgi:hypothetical protein
VLSLRHRDEAIAPREQETTSREQETTSTGG